MTHTPLLRNTNAIPYSPRRVSAEYYIGVKSISVNGKAVPLNATLLSFDDEGSGGTKISTVEPYTLLETSIYRAVVEAFVRELPPGVVIGVPRVGPFGACFRGFTTSWTQVPSIDLVLRGGKYWRFVGANSVVQFEKDVACLGFVEGGGDGLFPVASIVIGAHQVEDSLLEFDLERSRFGFGLSFSCANFSSAPPHAS